MAAHFSGQSDQRDSRSISRENVGFGQGIVKLNDTDCPIVNLESEVRESYALNVTDKLFRSSVSPGENMNLTDPTTLAGDHPGSRHAGDSANC
jgi:hypothetical protein